MDATARTHDIDPPSGMGLRERKKRRTREQIAQAAHALFAERGFDAVTVVEVARAADVAEKTVFNHFPTKEDLVFSGMDTFEQELLTAVRERSSGEPMLAAFGRCLVQPRGLLAEGDARNAQRLSDIHRTVAASPALRAREQQIIAAYTRALADQIAGEVDADPADVRPWVAANAMMGVHRALIDTVRQRAVAGHPPPSPEEMAALAAAALELLGDGLGAYPPRPQTVGP